MTHTEFAAANTQIGGSKLSALLKNDLRNFVMTAYTDIKIT